jgi:hypothetical protein
MWRRHPSCRPARQEGYRSTGDPHRGESHRSLNMHDTFPAIFLLRKEGCEATHRQSNLQCRTFAILSKEPSARITLDRSLSKSSERTGARGVSDRAPGGGQRHGTSRRFSRVANSESMMKTRWLPSATWRIARTRARPVGVLRNTTSSSLSPRSATFFRRAGVSSAESG